MDGWKAKQLTLAGKITLAKTILTSTPLYSMQSNKLPKMLCNNIDKTVKNFIWGSSKDERKLHLINWEIMTKGKDMGGLGIRSMQKMSLAFMAKLRWRLLLAKNELWAQILHSKYVKRNLEVSKIKKKRKSSNAYQGSVVAKSIIKKGMKSKVYNGKNTLFYRDKWLENSLLLDSTLKDIILEESYKTVEMYWSGQGGWVWEALQGKPPPQILLKWEP